jgi:hypothetical protein
LITTYCGVSGNVAPGAYVTRTIESVHTTRRSVPRSIVSTAPSGCCFTSLTGFSAFHCAAAELASNRMQESVFQRIEIGRVFTIVSVYGPAPGSARTVLWIFALPGRPETESYCISVVLPVSSVFADELPTRIPKSPGSATHPCFVTS